MSEERMAAREPRATVSLEKAKAVALAFKPDRAKVLQQTAADLQALAVEEAGFDRIVADERGLTSGMRLHLLQPARQFLANWRQARSEFDRVIQPQMKDINAAESLLREANDARQRRDDEIVSEERKLAVDSRYVEIAQRWREAESRYTSFRERHAMRDANMFGKTWLYWVLILLIGVAEWQINYRTFEQFLPTQAMAAGTTAILGVALAFAAHWHGEIIKQYTHRFGPDRDDYQRFGSWRQLGLATLALLVVLTAAGGSRYSITMSAIAPPDVTDITHSAVVTGINPVRDVMLSLLGNIAAWIVGVVISYMGHDQDPDYMDATTQFFRAKKRYYTARRPITRQLRVIEARYKKEIDEKETVARTRATAVAGATAELAEIRKHEDAVIAACIAAVGGNAESYRDALSGYAAKRGINISFGRGSDGSTISPYEYKGMKLLIDRELMESLQ